MRSSESLRHRPLRTFAIAAGMSGLALLGGLLVNERSEQNERYHNRVTAALGNIGVAECSDGSADYPCIESISLSTAKTIIRTGPAENDTQVVHCDTFDERPYQKQEDQGCYLPDESSAFHPYAIPITSREQLAQAAPDQS